MSAYVDHAKNQLIKLQDRISQSEASSSKARLFIKEIYINEFKIEHDIAARASLLWYVRLNEFNDIIGEIIKTIISYKIKSLITLFEIRIEDLEYIKDHEEIYKAFLDVNRQAHIDI